MWMRRETLREEVFFFSLQGKFAFFISGQRAKINICCFFSRISVETLSFFFVKPISNVCEFNSVVDFTMNVNFVVRARTSRHNCRSFSTSSTLRFACFSNSFSFFERAVYMCSVCVCVCMRVSYFLCYFSSSVSSFCLDGEYVSVGTVQFQSVKTRSVQFVSVRR